PMVSAAALALAEQGVLQLDDPVEKFIPAFRPRLADGSAPTITIRHLMTHTSGLAYGFAQGADGPYLRAGVSDGLDTPGRSIDDNIARIVSVPLSYAPGSNWAYSVATDVLGEVMARAGGAALPDLVDKLVATPLGMKDTAFAVRDRSRLARAYADDAAGPVPMAAHHRVPYGDGAISFAPDRTFDPSSFASGGAGLNGTAREVLSFLEALRMGGGPVIGRESVEALGTDAIDGIDTAMPGWGWGLGFAVLRDPAAGMTPQSVGTWRWGGVYGHSWFVDRAAGLSMV
ncbi:serine hydrolase domain-containing protein, partial [Rhizobiaceae sp. 2RAB30]